MMYTMMKENGLELVNIAPVNILNILNIIIKIILIYLLNKNDIMMHMDINIIMLYFKLK